MAAASSSKAKGKLASGLAITPTLVEAHAQCRKRAWLEVHHPELKERPLDAAYWQRQAEAVNKASRRQFAGAFQVQGGPAAALKHTQELLKRHRKPTLLGATFQSGDVLTQLDVLEVRTGSVLTEVSASTFDGEQLKLEKSERVARRLAVGMHVLQNKRRKVAKVQVHAIDSDTPWGGADPTYNDILRLVDLHEDTAKQRSTLKNKLQDIRVVVAGTEPHVDMTRHCRKPFDCPFTSYCKGLIRPEFSICDIPGKHWRVQDAWAEEGYYDIGDIPDDVVRQAPFEVQRVVQACRTGRPYRAQAAVRAALQALPYPRYFFDFESISLALPTWAGRRAYEQVPFQWSLHVQSASGAFKHKAFLDLTGKDPARACAEATVRALGKRGPVIVYHASYEDHRLREMAEKFPDLEKALTAIRARLVDLEVLVRNHYYHPEMRGSYSIKKVLPCLVPELTYDELEGVQNGVDAQMAYLDAVTSLTDPARFGQLRMQLLTYCAHDTWAMVALACKLAGRKIPPRPRNTPAPSGTNRFKKARLELAHNPKAWQLWEGQKPALEAVVHFVEPLPAAREGAAKSSKTTKATKSTKGPARAKAKAAPRKRLSQPRAPAKTKTATTNKRSTPAKKAGVLRKK